MSDRGQLQKEQLPLFLLYSEDGAEISGITRFQKLVFLAQQGGLEQDPIEPLEDAEMFEYEPNDYGPFSRELYDTLDRLVDRGHVEVNTERTPYGNERKDYSLTTKGKRRASEEFSDLPEDPEDLDHSLKVLKAVKHLYNDRPIVGLIDELYAEYPEYAKDSVLK
ncbi:MAG: putative transcriptional regulator [halophilic archaeon J07HB67]|jgi:Transcriptional regulator PadR-like family.|nr:MAG: putative transcriptional regulator [halophilic archaeon J07HB67]